MNTPVHQHKPNTSHQMHAPRTAPKKRFGARRPFERNRRPTRPPTDLAPSAESMIPKTAHIPAPEAGVVRIIPLGGVEEIGKNMTAIEIGNDIIVIDAGMHFATGETPGIDYVIPNTRYLEERKDKIRALIITHGHLDHIGGVPLVLSRIGNPPVYSRNLTVLLMKKRQSEFPHLPAMNINIVEKDDVVTLGAIKVRFWGVTHTIPDSMGVIIETPHGLIVNPGDYKLDQIDGIVTASEEAEYKQFDNANVLLLMTDSTNIENEGFALPEVKVHQGLENILRREKNNRIFMAAFASHITRLIRVVQIAEELGKKIVLEGRSMKTNVEIAIQAGLLKPKKDTIISVDEIENYPPSRILVLITGAQGEEFGGLNRLAQKTNKKLSLKKGDRIILSASVIPGNERAVQSMKDGLSRQGVKIISYRTPGEEYVHATGHGNKEDIKWLHRKMNEKFFIPIHGHHYHLELHKELAMEIGMPEDHIVVPDNGSIIEISADGQKISVRKDKAPASPMIVDGFSVGDEQNVVLRDRQLLAEDGMFIIMAVLDTRNNSLKKSPDIISRGFVYLKENQELLRQTRILVKRTIEQAASRQPLNGDALKNDLAETVAKFLLQKTAKRPLVIPVILTI
ncbi:ribonuclease J [Candidatus Nomurabacteria bacterium]|nr:ribonuclease J [Candidatus Nomurabacteria bacterium]